MSSCPGGFVSALCLLLIGQLAPSRAQAAGGQGWSTHWSSDTECTEPSDFARRVDALVKNDDYAAQQLQFEVRVRSLTPELMELILSQHGPTGEREGARVVQLTSCEAVRSAAAVLVAMSLDPSQPPKAAVEAPAPSVAAPRFAVSSALLLDASSLPSPSAGLALGAALSWRGLRLSLQGQWLAARPVTGDLPTEADANIGLLGGALATAYRFGWGRVAVGPTLALQLAALRARSSGLPEARTATALLPMLGAGATLELGILPWLSGQLDVLGEVALKRSRFGLEGGPVLYTVPVAALRVSLGVLIWLDLKD